MRLAGGAEVRAALVLANADVKRTFLELVPRAALPAEFVAAVARLRTQAAYYKFHAALDDLPDFSRYGITDPRMLAQIKICPSLGYYRKAWGDARRGRKAKRRGVALDVVRGVE